MFGEPEMQKSMFAVLMVLMSTSVTYAGGVKSPGKSTFKANCIFCHGEDGTGKTPPGIALGAHNHTSPEVGKKTDAELRQTILQGRNKMPPFATKLDENQIHELILYIRTLQK
jgi:mono/diheme cytochrome c family protein